MTRLCVPFPATTAPLVTVAVYPFGYCVAGRKTTVVAPENMLRILATNELDGAFRASPAVSGRSLILRSETHLYRIEHSK